MFTEFNFDIDYFLQLVEYYEVIKNPMALEIVKKKLLPDSSEHYDSLEEFVKDIRLIFKNCYEFNPVSGYS